MKRIALLVLVLAAGCGKEESSSSSSSSTPEWKASTPKEWVESCDAAQKRKDFAALWDKGMSKAVQAEGEKKVKELQDMCKDKAMLERFKKEVGIGDDWPTLTVTVRRA